MYVLHIPTTIAFFFAATSLSSTSGIWQMMSNSVTFVHVASQHAIPTLTKISRAKRSFFSTEIEELILDKHNELRRERPSSNMEILTWNDYLADMADDWAKGCAWEHGQPERSNETLHFQKIGQNLYTSNGTFDPVSAIQMWYDEVEYYNNTTGHCSKPPCGHYTQIVWSSSRELGCAWAYCSSMTKSDIINANYLVCNYGPTGNYIGQQPYKEGQACSGCEDGQFWCDNGLCRRDCTRQSTKCTCEANCRNCGRTIQENCTCECMSGWHGADCSKPCQNTHEYCGANPGWPVAWCNVSYVADFCPVLCSFCIEWTPGIAAECGNEDNGPKVTTPSTRRKWTKPVTSSEMYQPNGNKSMTPTDPHKYITTITSTLITGHNEISPKDNSHAGNATTASTINGAVMIPQPNMFLLLTIMAIVCFCTNCDEVNL